MLDDPTSLDGLGRLHPCGLKGFSPWTVVPGDLRNLLQARSAQQVSSKATLRGTLWIVFKLLGGRTWFRTHVFRSC